LETVSVASLLELLQVMNHKEIISDDTNWI